MPIGLSFLGGKSWHGPKIATNGGLFWPDATVWVETGRNMFEVPVEFFPMREQDLAAVAALEAEAQAFPWRHEHFLDSLQAGYSCWVCAQGGVLLGFSIVMQVMDEAHLLNIAIAKAYQGRGLGARLLQSVLESARLNHVRSMFLEVRVSNQRAIDLYRHLGFRQIAVRPGYYPAAEGREEALVFKKEFQ